MKELKYKEINEKIIGASFEVYSFLGNGFEEVIYQRALAWEMLQVNLTFNRTKSVKSSNPCKSMIQTICDIVKAHGRNIQVESEKGSKFLIKIPMRSI